MQSQENPDQRVMYRKERKRGSIVAVWDRDSVRSNYPTHSVYMPLSNLQVSKISHGASYFQTPRMAC